jgi:predicted nucleotidyltransferase
MGSPENKSDQPTPENIIPLLAPLQALQNLLSLFDDRGVIIGGIAVSLLGSPRYTADLDAVFLLTLQDLPPLLEKAAKLGIEPRISDPIGFARKNRILLLRHVSSGIDIDLSLGILPFEVEMVERSIEIDVGQLKLRLPTPEDLIIMKAIAHRPKDLVDIQTVAANYPELDEERIHFWVDQFSEVLGLPNLWKDISQYLSRPPLTP